MDTAARIGVGTDVAWTDLAADVAAQAEQWAQRCLATGGWESAAHRLRESVVRPLRELPGVTVGPGRPAVGSGPSGVTGDDLDMLLMRTTDRLAARFAAVDDAPAAAVEALAALMDLALRGPQIGPGIDRAQRRRQLAELVTAAPRRIVVRRDGPYLVTNASEVKDALGLTTPLAPVMALCRCGVSAIKPLCDGSHARVGFHVVPDPTWLPDERLPYEGPAGTILDNRRMCARSELCSTRLPVVFHQDRAPFVTPSGGRLDEVVRAVLQCPSGALTFRLSGHDIRGDHGPDVASVTVTRDGPYQMIGDLPLVDEDRRPLPLGEGAPADRYSLCRCGQTRNAPLCSGRHRDVHFVDPMPDREQLPSLFEWAGGLPAFERLMRRFYETYVPADPLLGPLFATMAPDHPERVAAWVAEVFGAPEVYSVPYGGFQRMMSRHLGGHFTEAQRARFVELIVRSADDAGLPADPEFRAAFVAYFEWGSRIAKETSQPGARPPRNMQMPRWNWIRDAVPGARPPSFARHESRPELVDPGPDGTVRFAVHIRPQFRKMDRLAMIYSFDLWNVESVRERAHAILARLRDGTMPVDGPWTPEAVGLFECWIDSGMSD
jgi:CDGSH-type Zn-finger protein/truncated hemoglobin YjbI